MPRSDMVQACEVMSVRIYRDRDGCIDVLSESKGAVEGTCY